MRLPLKYGLAGIGVALVLGWRLLPSREEQATLPPPLSSGWAADATTAGQAGLPDFEAAKPSVGQGRDSAQFLRVLTADLGDERIETETWRPGAELRELIEGFARSDPQSALQLIESHTTDQFVRHVLAGLVARIWGETNPAAAWQWVEAESHNWGIDGRPPLFTEVLVGTARSDPSAVVLHATEALHRRASGTHFDSGTVVLHAVRALLQADETSLAMAAVRRWCEDSPAAPVDAHVVNVIVHAVASRSPREAQDWLRGLPPSVVPPEALTTLATRWAESAPVDALAWAVALPANAARHAAIERAFRVWSGNDAEAALQWLASNTAFTASDPLLISFLDRPAFRTEYPEAAVQLAEMIRDGAVRAAVLQSAVLAWSNQNPAAAWQYAEAAPSLSAEQRSRLLVSLQHHAEFGFY
jgi:hypothetical protein